MKWTIDNILDSIEYCANKERLALCNECPMVHSVGATPGECIIWDMLSDGYEWDKIEMQLLNTRIDPVEILIRALIIEEINDGKLSL